VVSYQLYCFLFSNDLCLGGDCSHCSVRLLSNKMAPGMRLGDLKADILDMGLAWGGGGGGHISALPLHV
jgi:hypothetical protein